MIRHYKNRSLQDIEGEEWRPIFGYEGMYEVSNLGRVKSLSRRVNDYFSIKSSILFQRQMGVDGYLLPHLSNKGVRSWRSVHRHAAKVFVPNPENKPYVNHKNGIKWDNRAVNLEWCTHSENVKHAFDVLGRKAGALGRIGSKHPMSKKVGQYSLAGIFLMEHDSIASAYRFIGIKKEGTMYAAVMNFNLTAHGYRWKYINGKYEPRKNKGVCTSGAKLTKEQVLEIFNSSGSSIQVAEKYPITERTVRDIRAGRKWTSLTKAAGAFEKPAEEGEDE